MCFLTVLIVGCADHGSFVWFSKYPRGQWAPSFSEYLLVAGDTVTVRVFGQEAVATPTRIRTDGKITLPFAGEIVAAGKSPVELGKEIEVRLKEFIVSPRVSVVLEQPGPVTVSMLGEIGNTGTLTLDPPVGLLQALAQAGGLSDFADRSAIFVLRRTPVFTRIRFTYDSLLKNEDGASAFQLRRGDVVVVE